MGRGEFASHLIFLSPKAQANQGLSNRNLGFLPVTNKHYYTNMFINFFSLFCVYNLSDFLQSIECTQIVSAHLYLWLTFITVCLILAMQHLSLNARTFLSSLDLSVYVSYPYITIEMTKLWGWCISSLLDRCLFFLRLPGPYIPGHAVILH